MTENDENGEEVKKKPVPPKRPQRVGPVGALAFRKLTSLAVPLRSALGHNHNRAFLNTKQNSPNLNTLNFFLKRGPTPAANEASTDSTGAATEASTGAAAGHETEATPPSRGGTPISVLKLSSLSTSRSGGGGGGGAGWNPQRAKIQLKLAIQRLRLLQGKKTQLAKTTRREIASLIEKGKIESAKIKVEGVMGDDLTIELLEVLELYCELLLARFGLLEQVREIDPGVSEAVIGIIYAAPRTELKELHVMRDMLMAKGGREFALACMENTDDCVPERITSKLVVATPSSELVDLYLYEIAKAYSVDWRPEGFPDPNAEVASPASAAVPTAPSLPTPSTPTKAPHHLPPFDNDSGFPQTPPVDPSAANATVVVRTSLPSPSVVPPATPAATPSRAANASTPTNKGGKEEDAFEALTRRFAELKKR